MIEQTARTIKTAHDLLRLRRFEKPYSEVTNPYSVILWDPDDSVSAWAYPRQYRQHHGDTVIIDGTNEIVKKTDDNADMWTGDFRIYKGQCWQDAVRPDAFLYGLVESPDEAAALIMAYASRHPAKQTRIEVPDAREQIIWQPIT